MRIARRQVRLVAVEAVVACRTALVIFDLTNEIPDVVCRRFSAKHKLIFGCFAFRARRHRLTGAIGRGCSIGAASAHSARGRSPARTSVGDGASGASRA
jgi:hypothetical protein